MEHKQQVGPGALRLDSAVLSVRALPEGAGAFMPLTRAKDGGEAFRPGSFLLVTKTPGLKPGIRRLVSGA